MDETTSELRSETKDFVELFRPVFKSSVKIVPWTDSEAVGLSIIKRYPKKGKFVPAVKNDGSPDSIALIKVGYSKRNVETKARVIVSINKASLYLLDNHWDYDFNDPNSPTKESLDKSKNSRQPIGLEDTTRYEYDVYKKKFHDLENDKYISPVHIVNSIYKNHIRTLTNWQLRTKMTVRDKLIQIIGPLSKILIKANLLLFGRQYKPEKYLGQGYFGTYAFKDLTVLTTERVKIFGTDFPVTNGTARTFIFFISLIFLLNYWKLSDFLGLFGLLDKAAGNSLFLVSLTSFMLFVFDRIIPYIFHFLVNFLILARLFLLRVKIRY